MPLPPRKDWTGRRVFVTGATGLLGSWLTRRLVELKADVVALVRDRVPRSLLVSEGTIERVSVVRGDVCHRETVERALQEYEIQDVLHLAAQTIVPIAEREPLATFRSNIEGTWTLLEAARHSPTLDAVVVASSDKSYGEQEVLPYDETMPLQGRHPYDVSKSCADLITQTYHATYDLPAAITRCGNLYGGGDLNFNRLVPGAIRAAWRREPFLIRSDGLLTRDYFYIADAVEAYLDLAEAVRSQPEKASGEAFNFSADERWSVADLARKVSEMMGSPAPPEILNEARHEIKDQWLSSEKARDRLGWRPRYTLEEGLRETIDWYTRYLETHEGDAS